MSSELQAPTSETVVMSTDILMRFLNTTPSSSRFTGGNDSIELVLGVLLCLILLMVCPLFAFRRNRLFCYRRCIKCNWTSEQKEAENETKKFIEEQLVPFTKILEISDFIDNMNGTKDDVEKGLCMSTSDKCQTPSLKGTISTNSSDGQSSDHEYDGNSIHDGEADTTLSSASLSEDKLVVNSNENIESRNSGIRLPAPSVCFESQQDIEKLDISYARIVASDCSICLNSYSIGEKVSWAALDCCHHAFHHDCIVEWFLTLGKKSHNQINQNNTNDEELGDDPLSKVAMSCPVCRQEFISSEKKTRNSA